MLKKKFLGVGTVGDRGQIAIPTEARRACKIRAGEKMAFFSLGENYGFMAIKVEKLSDIFEHITRKAKKFGSLIRKLSR